MSRQHNSAMKSANLKQATELDSPALSYRHIIAGVIEPDPSPAAVREFASRCYAMAHAYLGARSRYRLLQRVAISPDDFCFDVAAGILERGPKGKFTLLRSWFSRLDLESKSEQELLSLLRRLVIARVQDRLVDDLRSSDPYVIRIMRNLRCAAAISTTVKEVQHDEEPWFCFGPTDDSLSSRPLMPSEYLEGLLAPFVVRTTLSPRLLPQIADLFTEQSMYRKSYPVAHLSAAIQNARIAVLLESGSGQDALSTVPTTEVERQLFHSVAFVETRLRRIFVRQLRVGKDLFGLYVRSATAILRATLFGKGEGRPTSFEIFGTFLPRVSRREYLLHHRKRLERFTTPLRQRVLTVMMQDGADYL